MSMERSRRDRFATHRVPLTWEIPAALLLAGLVFALLTPLVVQGLVGRATSGKFTWPSRHLLDAYDGLRHGQFGAGLRGAVDAGLPPDWLMWSLTMIGEVVVLCAAIGVGLWIRDLTGTSSRHGLATATRAAEALGLRRLGKSAAVIRPDLYARPPRPVRRPNRRAKPAGSRRHNGCRRKEPRWPKP